MIPASRSTLLISPQTQYEVANHNDKTPRVCLPFPGAAHGLHSVPTPISLRPFRCFFTKPRTKGVNFYVSNSLPHFLSPPHCFYIQSILCKPNVCVPQLRLTLAIKMPSPYKTSGEKKLSLGQNTSGKNYFVLPNE